MLSLKNQPIFGFKFYPMSFINVKSIFDLLDHLIFSPLKNVYLFQEKEGEEHFEKEIQNINTDKK